ncbi:MAG: DHA2 family efflux MFS transporter permease subunit [Ktedonobacteraceae bacterium]
MTTQQKQLNERSFIHRWWVLVIASLATLLAAASAADIALALKPMLDEFHAGSQALVWVSLAYLVPFATVLLVAGKLADTYGHKGVLLWSLALFTVTSALGFVAWDVPSTIVIRALEGFGGAGLLVSLAFVSLNFPGEGRGLALGLWRAALLAGTVGGPPLGGLLAATLGWRSTMWAMAPFALIALVLGWLLLRETPGEHKAGAARRFDWRGAIATLVGLSALVVALNFTGSAASGSGNASAGSSMGMGGGGGMGILITVLYLVFLFSAVIFWWAVRHHPHPIIQLRLFTIPRFVYANLGTLIICVGMFSVMFFVPLFLQFQQGYSTLSAASAILPVTVTAFLFGLLGGWVGERFGNALPSLVGFGLLAVGFVLLAQLTPSTPYGLTAVALSIAGIGMSLPLAPTASAALSSVPQEAAGEASGIFNLFHNLGRPFGLASLGVILAVQSAASYQQIFWLSAIVAGVGVLTALGLGWRTKVRSQKALCAPEVAH